MKVLCNIISNVFLFVSIINMIKLLLVVGTIWTVAALETGCRNTPLSPVIVICENMQIGTGKTLKLEGQLSKNEKIVQVIMNNVTGHIDENTFSVLPKVVDLQIDRSKLEKFSPNLLLEELQIEYSSIGKIDFKNFRSLEILSMVNVTGPTIENESLKYLENLTHLRMTQFLPTNLTKLKLEGLKNLERLELGPDLVDIEEDAFDEVENLKILKLEDNTFSSLKPNTFKKLKKLELFSLIGCSNLEELDLDMFTEQRNLRTIGLPVKVLRGITPEKLIRRFSQLGSLILEYEHQQCEGVESFAEKLEKMNIDVTYYSSGKDKLPDCSIISS